jgi:hypothetical protein
MNAFIGSLLEVSPANLEQRDANDEPRIQGRMNEMVFGSWCGDRNDGQAALAGISASTRQENDGQEDLDDGGEEDREESTELGETSNAFWWKSYTCEVHGSCMDFCVGWHDCNHVGRNALTSTAHDSATLVL